MAMSDNGTAVEVVSKVNGGVDVPTIVCALAATEHNRNMTLIVRIRTMIFMVKELSIKNRKTGDQEIHLFIQPGAQTKKQRAGE